MDLQQYFHVLGLMFQQKYGGFYTSKYSFMFQKMNQLKGSTHKKLSNSAWSQHWPQSGWVPPAGCSQDCQPHGTPRAT